MRMLLVLLLASSTAQAQEITVLERRDLPLGQSAAPATHRLRLTLAYLEGSGWAPDLIIAAVRDGARILQQCGVRLERAELVHIGAPRRYLDFFTPDSRELASAVALPKPTVYFVAGTRQRPAFDAEAIGWSNSRSRPELADTVWVTRGTRDLGVSIAHELVHVLMDSGEHSIHARNLMNAETAPENTQLSPDQCERLRATGSANGLISPR